MYDQNKKNEFTHKYWKGLLIYIYMKQGKITDNIVENFELQVNYYQ